MAQGAGADDAVAMDGGNDVAAVAARAGGGAGHSTMVLDLMVFIIAGIGGVASGAVRSKACDDGISDQCHLWADDCVMASGA